MCAKYTCRNRGIGRQGAGEEVGEQALCLRGSGSRAEPGPGALFRFRPERELRHKEQPAADLSHGQVHASLGIGEDPVGEDALEQPRAGFRRGGALHTYQCQHPAVDRADELPANAHLRLTDTLDEGNHGQSLRHGVEDGFWRTESVTFGAVFSTRGETRMGRRCGLALIACALAGAAFAQTPAPPPTPAPPTAPAAQAAPSAAL